MAWVCLPVCNAGQCEEPAIESALWPLDWKCQGLVLHQNCQAPRVAPICRVCSDSGGKDLIFSFTAGKTEENRLESVMDSHIPNFSQELLLPVTESSQKGRAEAVHQSPPYKLSKRQRAPFGGAPTREPTAGHGSRLPASVGDKMWLQGMKSACCFLLEVLPAEKELQQRLSLSHLHPLGLSFSHLPFWPFVLPASLFVGWVPAELFTRLAELSSSKSRRVNPTWDSSREEEGEEVAFVCVWLGGADT